MISLDFQETATNLKIKAVAFNEASQEIDLNIAFGKKYAISQAVVQATFGNKLPDYHTGELLLFTHTKVQYKSLSKFTSNIDSFFSLSAPSLIC